MHLPLVCLVAEPVLDDRPGACEAKNEIDPREVCHGGQGEGHVQVGVAGPYEWGPVAL